MTHVTGPASDQRFNPSVRLALIGAAVLLLVELTVIGTLFKHLIDFRCLDHWPGTVCRGASNSLVAIYCMLAVVVLLRMLRPEPLAVLTQNAGQRLRPLWVNGIGVCIALIPLTLLNGAQGQGAMIPAFALWAVGMALMLVGVALFIAPFHRLRTYLLTEWTALLPAGLAALAAPWLSQRLQPIWSVEWIADMTFSAVVRIMTNVGYALEADVEQKIIGGAEFKVRVANVCSGIEGIALVTLFVSLYLWLFRKDLRFPLALILYPIGIATSVVFNILRISLLLFIGLEGNPELAVGGFHSHAGWMMFTLVALGVLALAQNVPALRQEQTAPASAPTATLPPFWQDPVVAQILPFAVFMLSALAASTLSQTPSAVYPIRVVLMIGVLALVLPFFRRLPWRIDPVAVGVGAVIAAYWVLIPVAPSEDPAPYGQLTGALLVGWFIARGLGTIVLIPVIEEAFFRGYLETRLRFGSSTLWLVVAAVASAVLFAALHGRWAEAFVAGLLFSWVAWRRGNLTDAIISHATANALIFAAAIATGNLAMI